MHVDNYNECILLGMMIRCLQKLAAGETKKQQRWTISITENYA